MQYKCPLRINVPHRRVLNFIGRQDLLTAVQDRFSCQPSERAVVLVGMGGAGKTQIALEICRQAEENIKFMAVIWIDASSLVSVAQSYKLIAKAISEDHKNKVDSEHLFSIFCEAGIDPG